ncbi:polysaccharide deacetylase family protein [Flavobacterium daejeonense]|uniref:polysaccharide deacetylase family protein n=1 Tax=Flavobacterium daejeonense TaxID=350893 RepID=UPI00054DC746|nr:polysaccharide deacetylase family protein [Flavobacterium daejeonense]
MHFTKNNLKIVFTALFLVINVFGQESQKIFSVAQYKSDKQCAISFTFDDGLEEHYTLVFPKLEELGFKATFWVNGNTINEGESGRMKEKPRTTWNQLKKMAQKGHEISNHGWTHKQLTRCTPEEMRYEIEYNDSVIEAKIGIKPITFCYPNNSKNSKVIEAASKNRVGTRIEQFQRGGKSTPEILNAKIDTILKNYQWYATMIHGISYGYDAFKGVSILWNHLDQVKALEDEIWVGTFRDISAYTKEQQSIQLKLKQQGEKWIIVPNLPLDKKLFNVPLTMIVNKEILSNCSVKQQGKKIKTSNLPDKILFDFDPYGGEIIVKGK